MNPDFNRYRDPEESITCEEGGSARHSFRSPAVSTGREIIQSRLLRRDSMTSETRCVQQLDTKERRMDDVLSERPSQFSADHGEDINSVYPRRATPKTDFIANRYECCSQQFHNSPLKFAITGDKTANKLDVSQRFAKYKVCVEEENKGSKIRNRFHSNNKILCNNIHPRVLNPMISITIVVELI
ncbi:hypothetical protein WN51_03693 [Melipona quadrifasciata]|uniref:Uncharacterized protein n=1 Tax=Melipona quadrifasciata TaxID=166423 RepID=A0A0M8ZT72_9HYME|nr:hypothetical protein WN51_03693 [Melipona quadrifasciata]